jgi:hypothetical protein
LPHFQISSNILNCRQKRGCCLGDGTVLFGDGLRKVDKPDVLIGAAGKNYQRPFGCKVFDKNYLNGIICSQLSTDSFTDIAS